MLNERPQQKCHQHYDYRWKKTFIQLHKDWKETETINIYIYIYTWLREYGKPFYFLYCYKCCLYHINRYNFTISFASLPLSSH